MLSFIKRLFALSELRGWLESNARRQFTMFMAYQLTREKYETRATYRGVVFSFDSIAAAIYFKMRWFGNEPSVG